MLYRIESRKSLSEIGKGLEAAAQKYKFGILAVHDLRAKMKDKGIEFDRDCVVYEVCNPSQAKKVLEANTEVSTALPCRISVYSEGGGVTLATLRPTALIGIFQTPALQAVAEEVEAIIVNMMKEAAA